MFSRTLFNWTVLRLHLASIITALTVCSCSVLFCPLKQLRKSQRKCVTSVAELTNVNIGLFQRNFLLFPFWLHFHSNTVNSRQRGVQTLWGNFFMAAMLVRHSDAREHTKVEMTGGGIITGALECSMRTERLTSHFGWTYWSGEPKSVGRTRDFKSHGEELKVSLNGFTLSLSSCVWRRCSASQLFSLQARSVLRRTLLRYREWKHLRRFNTCLRSSISCHKRAYR